ncbi:MAG TPA: alpha/beta hydrolase [Acidimicrobiales bacterium]|nr:alpha/beta hydrolase [Acidimicrobiales bacterium]
MLRSYGDSRVFGESYGTGPIRVVWLHGWARSARDFSAAAQRLADRGIASVALDLPGFGSSPAPDSPGGAQLYAELIVPCLREISESPLVLVGHSFGGRVALLVASTHPELVRELVLTGVPLVRIGPTRQPSRRYRLVRWLAGHHLITEARLESARQKFGSRDYRNASGVIRDVLVATTQENYESALSSLQTPVSFLWGEGDDQAPPEVAERAAQLVTSVSSVTVLAGVGHFVPLEAVDALVDETIKALGS